MPSTTNVMDEARELVTKRFVEVDAERQQLQRVLAELGGKMSGRGARPGRSRGSSARGGRSKRPRRRNGTRAEQAVKLIDANPGITAAEIGRKMRMKSTHIYTVVGKLAKEGRVKKDGRMYFPVA